MAATAKEKGLAASTTNPPDTNQPANSAASEPVAQPMSQYARKREAKLQALAALQGVALHRLADGRWLACRWGLSRELADSDVQPWLNRMGGAS